MRSAFCWLKKAIAWGEWEMRCKPPLSNGPKDSKQHRHFDCACSVEPFFSLIAPLFSNFVIEEGCCKLFNFGLLPNLPQHGLQVVLGIHVFNILWNDLR